MRLKSIKLAGFKSFVDPTKVNLPGNLCAVVGPNGCGKSNIIDAVRWVMGESSAKNLRGENATDVIFNGSTSRQPVGQSTVELIFDNQDKTLAGEYASYNEVSIRRKVTREGQSTYYLNGQKCRRRDVTDLFLGTGLGPRSYSIIEQGTISRLIESRPEELRVYIEEAAGISRYKERRRDTSNRINRTRENLLRLEDIRDELARQLDTLKQQAQAAEQYTQLKQSERQYKSQLGALKWRDLKQELTHQKDIIERISEQIVLQRSEQDVRFSQIDVQKNDLAVVNESFAQRQGEFYSLGATIARIEQTIEHQKTQQQRWLVDVSETQTQLNRIDEAYQSDSNELDLLTKQHEELTLDAELASEQALESEQMLQDKQDQYHATQLLVQQGTHRQAQVSGQIDVANTSLRLKQQQIEQANVDRENCEAQLQELSTPDDEELALLSEQIELQTHSQAEIGEQISTHEAAIAGLRLEERAVQEGLDAKVQELGVLGGHLSSLELLIFEAEAEATQLPSQWQTQECQKLIDTLSVEQGFEVAVEHVLQEWLGAFVMPQWPDQNVLELSKAKGLALMLPGTDANALSLGNEYPSLLEKISTPTSLEGLLACVYVADDEHSAHTMLKALPAYASVILPSGLWLGHGWVKTPLKEGSATGILERKQRIQAMRAQQETLLNEQIAGQLQLESLRAKTARAESELVERRASWQTGQEILKQAQQKLAVLELHSKQVSEKRSGLEQRIQEQSERLMALEEDTLSLQESLSEQQLTLENTQLDLPKLEGEKETAEAQLNQARVDASQKQQHLVQLRAQISSMSAQMVSLGRSVERMQEQRIQWSKKQEELKESELTKSSGVDDSLTEQLESALEKRLEAEEELELKRHEISELEQSVRQLEQEQLKKENDIQNAAAQLQDQRLAERELEVNAENIKQSMLEQNINVEKFADALADDLNEQQISRLLEQCQNRIKRLGAINLVAIEEYKTQQERKVFLDQQYDELIEALESLEQAIAKIDKETKERFKQTFDTVNESLSLLFPKVFGGGRASLELTDDDMLATGVTIMAQPPGKRNSSIHLLSGGEKALTAIALVFSIFKLNPSPFCMLDEVDAPLDDANVGRYARLVKEMSSQVQFIYISHNKIAMEMATQLLGVTMQEAGVSRLVTVDMAQAINMTEQKLTF